MTVAAVGEPGPAPRVVGVLHSHLLVAEVVALWLGRSPSLVCRPPTSDVRQLLRRLPECDAVVLDQRTFDRTSDELLPSGPTPPVVVLGDDSSRDQLEDCLRSLRRGARAWVAPDAPPDLLVDAVVAVLAGRLWLPPSLGGAVVERLLEGERQRPRLDALTSRELEVLRHLLAGHSTTVTAELMYVSHNTVRSHRNRMFSKLGVHTALEAVAVARSAGMMPSH